MLLGERHLEWMGAFFLLMRRCPPPDPGNCCAKILEEQIVAEAALTIGRDRISTLSTAD